MTYKRVSFSLIPVLVLAGLFLAFIWAQLIFLAPSSHAWLIAILLNALFIFPSNVLHELAHASILKRNGYDYVITMFSLVPRIEILEPIPVAQYRSSLVAPYRVFRDIALFAVIMLVAFGQFLPQTLTIFIQIRIVLQFFGCGMDLFFAWKIRDVPDDWWVVDLGRDAYIFPTKEAALTKLSPRKR